MARELETRCGGEDGGSDKLEIVVDVSWVPSSYSRRAVDDAADALYFMYILRPDMCVCDVCLGVERDESDIGGLCDATAHRPNGGDRRDEDAVCPCRFVRSLVGANSGRAVGGRDEQGAS